MNNRFNAKLLLFGEYGIIKGAKGLAVPFPKYFGYLKSDINNSKNKLDLAEFIGYIEGSSILTKELDIETLKKDNERGLVFDSNIPIGHGIGSSGALCASIYSKYAKNFVRKKQYNVEELKYLKDVMALMESYYHGSSSGIDCLISLIDKPLQLNGRNDFQLFSSENSQKLGYFYIYNTGVSRKTSPLVHQFLSDYENNLEYRNMFLEYKKLSDEVIELFVLGEKEIFKNQMEKLSKLQFMAFKKMICPRIEEVWIEGIEKKELSVKLCGAGGGGFYLIYSPHKEILHPNFLKVNL